MNKPWRLSPTSSQARAIHLGRIAGQHRGRYTELAHLDRTIRSLRQLVPPSSNRPISATVNTLDEMETLLDDAITFLTKIAEDPELVTTIQAEYASRSISRITSNDSALNSSPEEPSTPADFNIDNLFILFKLKRGLRKRITPRRI